MSRRPNLLILGASGHVGRAVLRRLASLRDRLGRVVLLDRTPAVLKDPYINLDALGCDFVEATLRVPAEEDAYRRLLRSRRIDLVLDVTDHDTLPLLRATDAEGAAYLNTCLSDAKWDVVDLVDEVFDDRTRPRRAPHIVCSGMNPGVVNMWVMIGIARHGLPRETTHFEFDSSVPESGWKPVVTWSRKEYLSETVWHPSGVVRGARVDRLHPNGLAHPVDLGPILRPIRRLRSYPTGFTILHEENLTLGRRLGIPSRFVYALHPRTTAHLRRLWRERKRLRLSDLEPADNTSERLQGSDLVGVRLDYGRRRVYYANEVANATVSGMNATCFQVAVGVDAALRVLLSDRLPRRVHFVGDLTGTSYAHHVLEMLPAEEHVFERVGDRWRRRGPPGRLTDR